MLTVAPGHCTRDSRSSYWCRLTSTSSRRNHHAIAVTPFPFERSTYLRDDINRRNSELCVRDEKRGFLRVWLVQPRCNGSSRRSLVAPWTARKSLILVAGGLGFEPRSTVCGRACPGSRSIGTPAQEAAEWGCASARLQCIRGNRCRALCGCGAVGAPRAFRPLAGIAGFRDCPQAP